jgi:hypothetical protein
MPVGVHNDGYNRREGGGISRLLRRCVLWRVGPGWYLITLIGIPMILVLGVIVLH